MKRTLAVLLLAVSSILPCGPSIGQSAERTDLADLGAEIVDRVREDFWDPEAAERWAARNAGYAEDLENTPEGRAAFVRKTRKRLAELQTSHTAYYTQDDRAWWDLKSIFGESVQLESAGLSARELELEGTTSWFVERAFAGGGGRGPRRPAGDRRG